MIIKENITLFICSHCNKHYFRKKSCEKHEPICSRNTENFGHCFGCEFDQIKLIDKNNKSHYCTKLETFTTPIYLAKQGKFYKSENESGNIAMPKLGTCKEFQSIPEADLDFEFSAEVKAKFEKLIENEITKHAL